MPPVLHIPFAELPRRGSQEVFAYEGRRRHRQRENVLELVTESVRPTGLVERRASP
jgi:hypothetical protein